MPSGLEIDRVEWLSASTQEVLVRVTGRCSGEPPAADAVLIVDDLGQRRSFPASADSPVDSAASRGSWSAAFLIPIELRPRLAAGLKLGLGEVEIDLPSAVTGAAVTAAAADALPAQVIDRAVLAERRARRAELTEDSLTERVGAAEAQAQNLEAQLGNLEQRLSEAQAERDRLDGDLRARERELRATRQREYAEQQLRVEAEDAQEHAGQESQAEIEDLRSRLAEAEQQALELSEEIEQARRHAAETHNAARATEQGAPHARHGGAAARIAEFEREAERLHDALERERIARHQAELALNDHLAQIDGQRQSRSREIASLERELERRTQIQEQLQAQLEALRAELERLRGELASQGDELSRAMAAVSERDRLLGQAQLDAERRSEALAVAEQALSQQLSAQRLQFERQVASVHATVAGLRSDLAQVQSQTLEREQRQAQLERLAAELAQTAASLRESYQRDLAELRDQVDRPAIEAEAEPDIARDPQQPADPSEKRPDVTRSAEAQQLIDDLTQAVGRLREREPEGEPEGHVTAAPAAPGPATAVADAEPAASGPVTAAADPAAPIPPGTPPVLITQPPAPVASLEAPPDGVSATERAGSASRGRTTVAWLSAALARLADLENPELAGRTIVALLPIGGLLVKAPLTYDLELDGFGAFRVELEPGRGLVTPRLAGEPPVGEFHVQGPMAAFAALAAGAAPRRLHGTRVSGKRRELRKLLRLMRRPLGLAEIVQAGLDLRAELALPVLVRAIDPAWTIGQRFVVAYRLDGLDPATLWVSVGDGAPVRVLETEPEQEVTATVAMSREAFVPVLAGAALPAEQRVTVTGDPKVVALLGQWLDRAQGLAISVA